MLISKGKVQAERIGRDWLVDSESLEMAQPRSSRPLSPRMAAALLALASGDGPSDLDLAENSRLEARLQLLRDSPVQADPLRSWFAGVEQRSLYPCRDLDFVRQDERLRPAGLSLPDGGLNDAGLYEAAVAPLDVDDVVARHLLRRSHPGQANVVLHVSGVQHYPHMWLLRAFHVAQHRNRSGREDAEVARIVAANA